jgi:NTP pyrophosphatase (non-canonical NTP hydrolase)
LVTEKVIDVINIAPREEENCYACPSQAAVVKGVRISYDGVEWAELRLCYKCAANLRQRLGGQYKNDLDQLQGEMHAWQVNNFDEAAPYEMVMGLVHEIGKLAHAELLDVQDIKGSPSVRQSRIKDAVGDAAIYLLQYCSSRRLSLATVLEDTWAAVSRRNWKRYRNTGIGIKTLPEGIRHGQYEDPDNDR